MVTYGRYETREQFSMKESLTVIARAMAELEEKRRRMVAACDHHFTPQEGALDGLTETLVKGVWDAGDIAFIDWKLRSTIFITLVCSRCGVSGAVRLSDRCPICGGAVTGEDEVDDRPEKYFGPGEANYAYMALWMLSCTECAFKAVGTYFDQ